MKKSHAYIALGILFTAALILLLNWTASSENLATTSRGRQGSHVQSNARPVHPTMDSASVQSPENDHLSFSQLPDRFALSGVQFLRLRREIYEMAEQLMEQKSLKARVDHSDGKILKMTVPGLRLSPDEIEEAMLAHLYLALGTDLSKAIWADASGRQALLDVIDIRLLEADATYTFDKVREETDPKQFGSAGHASFNVAAHFDLDRLGESARQEAANRYYQGFNYTEIYSQFLGWNALAKAPANYFRSEPIVGVASRPPPAIVVIEDRATGRMDFQNVRYPGSKDSLPSEDKKSN